MNPEQKVLEYMEFYEAWLVWQIETYAVLMKEEGQPNTEFSKARIMAFDVALKVFRKYLDLARNVINPEDKT